MNTHLDIFGGLVVAAAAGLRQPREMEWRIRRGGREDGVAVVAVAAKNVGIQVRSVRPNYGAQLRIDADLGEIRRVAQRFEDGLFLLDLHRHLAPPDGHARAAIPDDHAAAWRELEARGWRPTWLAPRMLQGPDVPWRPQWIWGLINSAMG